MARRSSGAGCRRVPGSRRLQAATPPPRAVLRPGHPLELRLCEAVAGGEPRLATRATLLDRGDALVVRFECADPEPRARYRRRDEPLWEEEVVELFVAPGEATPTRYYELEVNPLGAVFDAIVDSPHGDRREMRVDPGWDCPGLEAGAEIDSAAGLWRALLVVPWAALDLDGERAETWRLNLFRIERPRDGATGRDGAPEYSAWSPTLVAPADFHRPARFASIRRILR